MTAYASGGLPWADGMLLEDYYDAVSFKACGVPPAVKWVDSLREQTERKSFSAVM